MRTNNQENKKQTNKNKKLMSVYKNLLGVGVSLASLGLVTSFSLALPVLAQQNTANVTASVTITGGALTVSADSALALTCTPACTVSATEQTATGSMAGPVVVTDARGSGVGWTLNAVMSNFVDANGNVLTLASATSGGTSYFEFTRGAIQKQAGSPAWVSTVGITDQTAVVTTTTLSNLTASGTSNTYDLATAAGLGSIGRINVTNGGTGYTSAPTVEVSGNGCTGVTATAQVSGGSVVSVTVTNPGSGCTGTPTVTFSGGGGSGATANAIRGTGEGTFEKSLTDFKLKIPPLSRAGTYTGTLVISVS